jgi:hypothetical protein
MGRRWRQSTHISKGTRSEPSGARACSGWQTRVLTLVVAKLLVERWPVEAVSFPGMYMGLCATWWVPAGGALLEEKLISSTVCRPYVGAMWGHHAHGSPPTKRNTGMKGGERNDNTPIYNISKGHGHQSSSSHPPLGRGEWGERHDTRRKHRQKMKGCTLNLPGTLAGTVRVGKHAARNGQANESSWVPIDTPFIYGNTLAAPRAMP